MNDLNLDRRGFGKFAVAAAGGLLAGMNTSEVQAKDQKADLGVDPALLLADPNTCKGLNTCKGKGKGQHECAGRGSCATVKAHSCAGENDCKGKGGCGGYPGQNTCKGKGECAVPLSADAWKLARKQFEQLMKATGKKVGPAPK